MYRSASAKRPARLGADQLSAVFAALADPTRRAMLAALGEGELTVLELAEPFDMSLPAISKHLKVLERAGLVGRARQAQWRPCRLDARPLMGAVEWMGQFALMWESVRAEEAPPRRTLARKKRARRPAR